MIDVHSAHGISLLSRLIRNRAIVRNYRANAIPWSSRSLIARLSVGINQLGVILGVLPQPVLWWPFPSKAVLPLLQRNASRAQPRLPNSLSILIPTQLKGHTVVWRCRELRPCKPLWRIEISLCSSIGSRCYPLIQELAKLRYVRI